MEKALIVHVGLGTPSQATFDELSNRLGGIEVEGCFQIRDMKKDQQQLQDMSARADIHAIRDVLLLIHPEEKGVRIALLIRYLLNAIEGVLTIVSVDEYWDRKQGTFVQEIIEVYPG